MTGEVHGALRGERLGGDGAAPGPAPGCRQGIYPIPYSIRSCGPGKLNSSIDLVCLSIYPSLLPLYIQVLWARQIERELRRLVRRVEDVLGPGWEKHVEGRQLKGVCDELLRSLDTEAFFRKWVQEVEEDLQQEGGQAAGGSSSRQQRLRQQRVLLVGRDREVNK